jgi:hypothetical protein
MLKVGDVVMWKGSFGRNDASPATITRMELTQLPRTKYGIEVNEIPWDMVRANRVVVVLDNGHWAYGEQIFECTKEELEEIQEQRYFQLDKQ